MESASEMSQRHREEWQTFRRNALDALLDRPGEADCNFVKNMKYVADTLRISHDGERRAFEFSAGEGKPDGPLLFVWDDGADNGEGSDTI